MFLTSCCADRTDFAEQGVFLECTDGFVRLRVEKPEDYVELSLQIDYCPWCGFQLWVEDGVTAVH